MLNEEKSRHTGICNTCGVKNEETNKFCINCGEELWQDLQDDETISSISSEEISQNECPECGTSNEPENKFCISCGNPLNSQQDKSPHVKKHSHTKKTEKHQHYYVSKKQLHRELRQRSSNNRNRRSRFDNIKGLKALWIVVGIIIGSVIIASAFDLIFHKYPDPEQTTVELKSSNPVIEAKVYEIASKFVCSCGTCNEESLEVCKCPTAIEERQFVRDYLEQNQKPDDIIVALANKYGWLKAQFASQYKIDPSKVWDPSGQIKLQEGIAPANIATTISESIQKPALQNVKAALSDRYAIYSSFRCPCGQCGIDELSECTCTHPGGAKEIKKFIDEKINENKYTVNEIINIVNSRFGGKKI